MTSPQVLAHTPVADWLHTTLAAALSVPVGDCEAPRDPAAPYALKKPPYLIVTPIPGGSYSAGTFGNPDGSGWTVWQVDSIGQQRRQVSLLADRVRGAILARDTAGGFVNGPDPEGLWITGRMCSTEAGGAQPAPEGDWPNQVWTAAERYELYTVERGAP